MKKEVGHSRQEASRQDARDAKKVQWISHRGFRACAVENTLQAFTAAVSLGFTCLETDLRSTVDGHLVLCHDRYLNRLGGPATAIDGMTRAQVEALGLQGGSRLLFFDEFMTHFAACQWIFDIKPETGGEVIALLGKWLDDHQARSWVLAQARFLFWRTEHERLLKALLPEAQCLPGEWACWRAGLAVLLRLPWLGGIEAGRSYALPPRLGKIRMHRKSLVAAYQKRGARVLAYLPTPGEETATALAVGVDEILTDYEKLTL